MENAPRKLNTKVYTMTIKEDRVQNQWLEEQLKAELIVESSSRYTVPCFYIPKKDRSLQLVQDYRKLNQHIIKDKIPLSLSMVYHSHIDGQTERINQEFKAFLQHYVNYQQGNLL